MRIITLRVLICIGCGTIARAESWKDDSVWHDGLVEKAVYSASRIVYGKPRAYEAIFFTNKEQHDRRTLTKAAASKDTVEVWKFNQIEAIPTPNYTYHYETTTHLTVEGFQLMRLECSSQEFCGTSFKQYMNIAGEGLNYWSFSYMPEAGRQHQTLPNDERIVAINSLPLVLRDFEFSNLVRRSILFLPDQRSNRPAAFVPVDGGLKFLGEEGGAYKIEAVFGDKSIGTFWMAKDRLDLMLRYRGEDGQQYDLKSVERVNYWTIKRE